MIFLDAQGHLISDESIKELHVFAHKIGLLREWFQGNTNHPHYDVWGHKWHLAIDEGATLVSSRDIIRAHKRRLKKEPFNKNSAKIIY